MIKKILLSALMAYTFSASLKAEALDAFDMYELVESLSGEWVLSPASKQIGTSSYKHKAVMPLMGTQKVGISFQSIARNSTVKEELLPNTAKEMVTMYHCKDIACTQIKATHYCVKQNQPEFIANLEKSHSNRLVFDCDMTTELCQSNENHVHTIIHELSNNKRHLKSSYLSWKNKKEVKNSSIYYFDKKE